MTPMAAPVDPRWPRLLGLAVHEFRTPITVVAGYLRMLLKDRAGAVTDQQRRLLEEAEKSCGRLSALVTEMSELSALEAGTATFNRSTIDLRALLREVADGMPPVPDRDIAIAVETEDGAASIEGDPVRLRVAFTSIIHALRRELIDSPGFFVREAARRRRARRAPAGRRE
jgi:signal transduction histidine kinase